MKQSTFKKAALSSAILSLLPCLVTAQEAEKKENWTQLEEVMVTGSHIRRDEDLLNPSPLQTLGMEEIKRAGAGQVQDLLKTLTVNAGSTLATSQNAQMGQSQFSLRGLGVGATLTLVNGRRAGVSPIATSDGAFFTDVNQYPVNMIERVEVLTDGASATYGSEAVGGVVNIYTRNNFEGVEFGAEFRESEEVDVYQFNVAIGSAFERGHFATFVNYLTHDGAFRGDFDFIRERDNPNDPGNQLDSGSSWDSGTGAGRYQLAEDLDGDGIYARTGGTVADQYCGSPNEVGVISTFESGSNCRYSFLNQRRLVAETTRLQSFTALNYDITDKVNLFSELSFSSNEIKDAIGGAVLRGTTDNGGFYVPGDHPFNYFVSDGEGGIAWDEAAVTADPSQAVGVIFRGRPLTNSDGALADDIVRKFDNSRVLFGIDAELTDSWYLNTSYMLARTQASDRQPRSYNPDAFRSAIGSGLWNPFGSAWATPNAVSVKDGETVARNDQDDLDLISTNRVFQWESKQEVAELIISGDLFETSAGPVSIAFGTQYRNLEWEEIADSLSYFLLDGRQDDGVVNTYAEQDVLSFFAESIIPATDRLEFQLALRYEDYGDGEGGDTTDPKVGVKWDITDAVAVRSSWGTSFQAPSVRQISGAVGNMSLDDAAAGDLNPGDPCLDEDAGDPIPNFNATVVTEGGELSPQSSTAYNFGLILQTGNFEGSLDYFTYDFEDRITELGSAQEIVDSECDADNLYAPNPAVKRDPSGQLNGVTTSFVNLDGVKASGFDLTLKYVFDDIAGGSLSLQGTTTLMTKFDMDLGGEAFDGLNNRNRFIGLGSLPEFRTNVQALWQNDIHTVSLTGRHIGAYEDRVPGSTAEEDAENEIDSQTVFDLQYSIALDGLIGDGTTSFSLGANNLFDEEPPAIYTDRIAFDGQVHNPQGRTVYLRAKHAF